MDKFFIFLAILVLFYIFFIEKRLDKSKERFIFCIITPTILTILLFIFQKNDFLSFAGRIYVALIMLIPIVLARHKPPKLEALSLVSFLIAYFSLVQFLNIKKDADFNPITSLIQSVIFFFGFFIFEKLRLKISKAKNKHENIQ